MFFALVLLPAGVSVLRAASTLKTHFRGRRAWKEESEGLKQKLGDISKRDLYTIDVLLTKEEVEAFGSTGAANFLKDRQLSDTAASYLKGQQ